jgi:hypothetical protein
MAMNMLMVFWVVTLCGLVGGYNISEELLSSISWEVVLWQSKPGIRIPVRPDER